MKTLRLFSLLLISLLFFNPTTVFAATLHTILVADTLAPDVGGPAAKDLEMMDAEMERIAHHTDLERKNYRLEGDAVKPQELLSIIEQLSVSEEDVVIFYFSGHGFRTLSSGDTPWPNLTFSQTDQALPLERVGQMLEHHKPRLLIMLADACNNYLPEFLAPSVLLRKGRSTPVDEDTLRENYRKLFVETKGVIIATGAEKGDFSWSTKRGSLFTIAFLNQLNRAILSPTTVDWAMLLERTADQVKLDQHPDYRIYLEE